MRQALIAVVVMCVASWAIAAQPAPLSDPQVQAIREAAPESGTVHLDPDTAMNPHSLGAALRAAGAAPGSSQVTKSGCSRTLFPVHLEA
jgi:hypothetical protein